MRILANIVTAVANRYQLRENLDICSHLISASETLFAGDIAGSASLTVYIFEYRDKKGERVKDQLVLPYLTGVVHSGAKKGDRITIHKNDKGLKIEVRGKFFGRLKHQYQASYEELERDYFS